MSREAFVGVLMGLVCAACAVETIDEAHQAELQAASISVSPHRGAISEAGDRAYFTVTLESMPYGPLRVTPATGSEAIAIPASLVFMPNDWGPKSFELVAVNDDAFDGDIPLQIALDVDTHDPRYAASPPQVLDVLSVDDDYVVTGYRMRELYPGSEGSNPAAINNRGQAVADVRYTGNTLHAYLWDDGAITDLGDPTRATDINDVGTVVGFYGDDRFSFKYEDGTVTMIPGQVKGINDRGHLSGDALYADGQRTDLMADPSVGLAINNIDHITGYFPESFRWRAFAWNGSFTDLGSFGGPRASGKSINEHDQVVGWMWDPQIHYHAFYYDGGAVVDLGTATGSVGAAATAINNRGDIAGYDHDGGLPTQGWVGRAGDLRTISSQLVDGSCFHQIEVVDMNDRGQILARGVECERGSPHSYVFEPVKVAR